MSFFNDWELDLGFRYIGYYISLEDYYDLSVMGYPSLLGTLNRTVNPSTYV